MSVVYVLVTRYGIKHFHDGLLCNMYSNRITTSCKLIIIINSYIMYPTLLKNSNYIGNCSTIKASSPRTVSVRVSGPGRSD